MQIRSTSIATAWMLLAAPIAFSQPGLSRSRDDAQMQWLQLVEKLTSAFHHAFDEGTPLSPVSSNCTPSNLVIRKEYGSLSKDERLNYIDAVKCLQRLPALTPSKLAAGAKSRYDDFVAVHINQTQTIHLTGNFMAWHRWFLYIYETALRDECNYTGYQPYWDWPKYQDAPQLSPIFFGPYSLGGNGDYIPHSDPILKPAPGQPGLEIPIPAGLGGGYVTTGPFANMTVNLGPVYPESGVPSGPDGGFGYNPRVLKRDVGPGVNQRYNNYTTVLDQLGKDNITNYRFLSEGVSGTVEIGPHSGGHFTIGAVGDPGGDLFTSPGDPAFWVHHCQMDRLWAMWQTLDPTTRYTDLDDGIYGHRTMENIPESPLATLDDVIDMGFAGPSTTIREMMSTTNNKLCYFYE